MNIEIFLGKSGQTFGPYTVEQFDAIKAQADFSTYTYIWDGRDAKPDWRPIEAAPSAPVKRGPGAPPPDNRPAPAAPKPVVLRGYDVPGIEVLCHDARTVMSGKLLQVTDSGCEFVAAQSGSEPGFGSNSKVMLNLLDSSTGKSMNVPARLNGVRRKDGAWSYQVLWQGCPQLVVQELEKSA